MKILFIKEQRSPSGIEGVAIYLLNICRELNKLNISYLVLYNAKDKFYNMMKKNEINVLFAPLPPSSAKNLFNRRDKVKAIKKLIFSIIQKEKITHINVHFPHLLGYIKKEWGIPIIAHWHGAFVENKPLKYFYWQDIFSIRKTINNFYSKLYVFNFSKADLVICPSIAAKNTAIIKFKIPNTKIKINPYGIRKINCTKYKNLRKKLRFRENDKVILSAGRETKAKGIEDFCQIAIVLSKSEQSYKFIFLGGYRDENYHNKLVKKYGDVVQFMGMREDIYDFYKTADLFLFLSHRESAGLVLAEAMFFGLPLVAWDIIGVNEMFKNNINGYLVPFGDTDNVAKHIEKIFNDKEIYKKFSKSSFVEASKHTIDNSAKELINLFKSVNIKKEAF